MSQMLTSSLTLLAGIVTLYIFGSFMMDGLKESTVKILTTMGRFELTEANLYVLVLKLFGTIVLLLAPLIVTIIATAVISSLVQDNGRFEFRLSRLKFSSMVIFFPWMMSYMGDFTREIYSLIATMRR